MLVEHHKNQCHRLLQPRIVASLFGEQHTVEGDAFDTYVACTSRPVRQFAAKSVQRGGWGGGAERIPIVNNVGVNIVFIMFFVFVLLNFCNAITIQIRGVHT